MVKLWLRICLFGIILKDRDFYPGRRINPPEIFDRQQYRVAGQYWKVRGKWRQRVVQLHFGYSIYL